jgi:hypothetical protein
MNSREPTDGRADEQGSGSEEKPASLKTGATFSENKVDAEARRAQGSKKLSGGISVNCELPGRGWPPGSVA